MKHVPHVVVPQPWDGKRLNLTIVQWRHLTKVLRLKSGREVTYTDGLGVFGHGILSSQEIERGEESQVQRPTHLTMAVAPPSNKDRQRFLVEKLAELGVAKLVWLDTKHGKGRVANPAKLFSWVLAATEQSRGSWLMETSGELVPIDSVEGSIAVCHPGGVDDPGDVDTVLVGPEGGFADEEIPGQVVVWDLGATILRVETAAITAVARLSNG